PPRRSGGGAGGRGPATPGPSDGTPRPLWGPLPGVAEPTSPRPLPVRDVVVFAAAGGGVAARQVTDGAARWRVGDAHADAGYLSIADRLVATADRDGAVHTHVAATGSPRWSADAAASTLLAADADHLYVLTDEGAVRCLTTADARERWTRTPPLTLTGGRPAAVLGAGLLVLCTATGDVLALHTRTGAKAWVRRGQAAAALAPAVDGGTVFVGGHTLAALRASDGKEVWSREPLGPVRRGAYGWGPPTVTGGVLYALDSEALRFLRPDGEEAHAAAFVVGVAPPWQPPVVQAGSVWVVESGDTGVSGLPRLGPNPTAAQTYPLTGGPSRTLAGEGNRLFVLNAGSLLALPVY
ncbi:PQQ-binding-like beta-propeller repeat protein, partial [Streptomyces sp. HSW2009]|uniref:outer membrane protein assembly factor BamB family protein n=1 Tax=Streptomyces sp. HSW2009 TaxID=3142890 RepID=UPI0032EE2E3B